MRIQRPSNQLQISLHAVNHSTLVRTELETLTISDPSQPYTNNLLAYRPRYNDVHRSGLGAIFINIEGVFPCVAPLSYVPICSTFTTEEDGFRSGKAIIDAADSGNNFQIFNTTTNIATYGIAFQQCPEFNDSCFPSFLSLTIACYLPRAACSETV